MSKTIIEGLREYINACPLLSDIPPLRRHIDWTDADSNNCGIYQDGDTLVKKAIGGGGKRCYAFSLYLNRISAEDVNRLENAGLMEKLQSYFRQASLDKNFPEMPPGKTPVKIEAENGIVVSETKKYAKYVIQFKLFYMERVG